MRHTEKIKDGAGRSAVFFSRFTPAAHRGASYQFPQNTLDAFRRALEILPGCLIETDVRITKDGVVVIFHDEMLDNNTDGAGPVRGMTLGGIRVLDAGFGMTFDGGKSFPFRAKGFRIPLMSDALDSFPAAKFSIDIKDNDFAAAEKVMEIIKERNAGARVIVGSFHDRIVRFARKHDGIAFTSFCKNEVIRFIAAQKLGLSGLMRVRGDAMLIPEFAGGAHYEYMGKGSAGGVRIITPGLIGAAHRHGIPVLAWTINRPDNMRRLIDWGIDGIVTDRIDILKKVMADKGMTPQ
jgi:glycerophosphoryl diester phosphodiesterase